jgi:hypothetical protein
VPLTAAGSNSNVTLSPGAVAAPLYANLQWSSEGRILLPESISTRAERKHQTPNFSWTRGAIPLAEMRSTQIIWCFVSAPKSRLHPFGTISWAVILAKGTRAAKRRSFVKRNASRTLPFARFYQRVVRSTTLTLESSEVFLQRERWDAWSPEPPAAVPNCSLVAGSTHALAFCRGRCGRSFLGGTRLSTSVHKLPPRDRASSIAHDVIALGARNDAF